ncbi:hypothetical protein TNCV_1099201 [Trichonephila clavipes]|nr:hypothetical protein TNCV_1099201 [Trichonephila clavipes]
MGAISDVPLDQNSKLSDEYHSRTLISPLLTSSLTLTFEVLTASKKSCKNFKTGMLANNEGRGRKKIMNSIIERRVIHQVKIGPKISAPKIAASTSNTLGRSVSAETVRRVLRKAGYNGRAARKKPLIGKRNSQAIEIR